MTDYRPFRGSEEERDLWIEDWLNSAHLRDERVQKVRPWVSSDEFELFLEDCLRTGQPIPKKLFSLGEVLRTQSSWIQIHEPQNAARSRLLNIKEGVGDPPGDQAGTYIETSIQRHNCRGTYGMVGYYQKFLHTTLMHYMVSPPGGVVRAPDTPLWLQGTFLLSSAQARTLFLNEGFRYIYGQLQDRETLNRQSVFILEDGLPSDRIYWAPYSHVADVVVWDQTEAYVQNSRITLALSYGIRMTPVDRNPLYEYPAEEVLGWMKSFAP